MFYIKFTKFNVNSILFVFILLLNLAIAFNGDACATNSSISVALDTDILSVNLPPTADGRFAKSSDATISVVTDYNYGYTLNIAAVNSTNLVSGNNNLPTLNNITSESDFSSSSDYNNKWGYSPSQYIDSGNIVVNTNRDFLPSPATTGSILDVTDSANPTTANTYSLSIGARVDTNLPIGSYANTFVVTAIANSVPYEITYYANTTDSVTDLPSPQVGSTYGTSVQLSSTKPSRAEYGFYGWCTVATTTASDCASRGGTTYRAGSDFDISQFGTNTLDLYAIWGTYSELDTGQNINAKMKTLANNGTSTAYNTNTEDIKAIRMANVLPLDFVSSEANTISITGSTHPPTYIWYDNTDNAGIIYVYTEAEKVRMNATSSSSFAYNLALVDISGVADWDLSIATTINNMFGNSPRLTSLEALKDWDVSSVSNMNWLFSNDSAVASSLTSLHGLEDWDTSNVTSLNYMFYGASSLTSLHGLEDWDTSNVTSLSSTFRGTASLTDISALSDWNTGNVVSLGYTFYESTSLTSLHGLEDWDTSRVNSLSHTFARSNASDSECSSSNINPSQLSDISALANWNTSSVTSMDHTFLCTSIDNTLALANWDVSSVTSLKQAFARSIYLNNLTGLAKWNTSSIVDMSFLFLDTNALTDFSPIATTQRNGYKSWDVSNVQTMEGTFATNLRKNNDAIIDLTPFSTWDTANLETLKQTFTNLDIASFEPLASWNTSSVTNLQQTFRYDLGSSTGADPAVDSLNGLGSWDTSSVTTMDRMFSNQRSLTDASAIDNWSINGVTNFNRMFNGVSTHPTFANRAGTWDANGTFTPSS